MNVALALTARCRHMRGLQYAGTSFQLAAQHVPYGGLHRVEARREHVAGWHTTADDLPDARERHV